MISRAFALLAVLLLVFACTRLLVRALPGDPIQTLVAESGTPVPSDELRAELGLDRPWLAALGQDLSRLARGDFGRSILSRAPIGPELGRRFARTAELALLAFLLGISASLALGLAACGDPSSRLARAADRVCTVHGGISAALPVTWLGPLLILLFAFLFPVFPLGGHVALPAICLALPMSGLWSRLIRERVREALASPAAAAARARGIPESRVSLKYGLMPVSGALAAYLGTQVGFLLGGAFVTEVIFQWPGLGSYLVGAVLARDYPVVEASVFVAAACALAGTALGDWAQRAIDPRGTGS